MATLLVSGVLDFQNTAQIINYPGGFQSRKYAVTITVPPTQQPTITHNLNSTDVHVQVYKVIPQPGPNPGTHLLATAVQIIDANNIFLSLNDDTGTFRVVVMA